jgi:hypothetical protein
MCLSCSTQLRDQIGLHLQLILCRGSLANLLDQYLTAWHCEGHLEFAVRCRNLVVDGGSCDIFQHIVNEGPHFSQDWPIEVEQIQPLLNLREDMNGQFVEHKLLEQLTYPATQIQGLDLQRRTVKCRAITQMHNMLANTVLY